MFYVADEARKNFTGAMKAFFGAGKRSYGNYLGRTVGSPPGLPGGGMTGMLPASGVGNFIAGSIAGGGQMTPSDCARRPLRLSGAGAGLCGSPSPVVAVPGDPGGNDGEQGADTPPDAPCPSA